MKLPHITNKQKEILLLLYRFRFLNRIQIQTLLHHKSTKNINTWLKDLTDKNYLGRILNTESRIKIFPAKYYISLNGIRLLKQHPLCESAYVTKMYKESRRSEQFIDRCLFIADIYIQLVQKYDPSHISFYTQSDYSREGIIKEILPLFVFRKGIDQPYFVVELFTENQPRFVIRSRIHQYITFFTKGEWSKNEKLPNILFISPNKTIEQYTVRFIHKLLEDEPNDLTMYISTIDQVKHDGIEGEIWEKV